MFILSIDQFIISSIYHFITSSRMFFIVIMGG